MTDGEEGDPRVERMTRAQDACDRSAACAAQALVAAESATAIAARVDRIIERVAERHPEHAEHLQAILVTAARTEPDGFPVDLAIVRDRAPADGEFHDAVIQRIYAAGLTLQDAAGRTAEPEVRWRIDAAVGDLDQLIGIIRGALFDSAHRPASRQPGSGPDDTSSSARRPGT